MHDIPNRSLNDKSEVVGNVVILPEWFYYKGSQSKPFAVLYGRYAKFWLIREVLLAFQDNGFRKGSPVHRRGAKLAEKIRNSSNVIVVAVRNKQGQNIFLFSFEVRDIGNNVVYPRHVFFRHTEAHINEQDFAFVFQYHHVSTNLAKAA